MSSDFYISTGSGAEKAINKSGHDLVRQSSLTIRQDTQTKPLCVIIANAIIVIVKVHLLTQIAAVPDAD